MPTHGHDSAPFLLNAAPAWLSDKQEGTVLLATGPRAWKRPWERRLLFHLRTHCEQLSLCGSTVPRGWGGPGTPPSSVVRAPGMASALPFLPLRAAPTRGPGLRSLCPEAAEPSWKEALSACHCLLRQRPLTAPSSRGGGIPSSLGLSRLFFCTNASPPSRRTPAAATSRSRALVPTAPLTGEAPARSLVTHEDTTGLHWATKQTQLQLNLARRAPSSHTLKASEPSFVSSSSTWNLSQIQYAGTTKMRMALKGTRGRQALPRFERMAGPGLSNPKRRRPLSTSSSVTLPAMGQGVNSENLSSSVRC